MSSRRASIRILPNSARPSAAAKLAVTGRYQQFSGANAWHFTASFSVMMHRQAVVELQLVRRVAMVIGERMLDRAPAAPRAGSQRSAPDCRSRRARARAARPSPPARVHRPRRAPGASTAPSSCMRALMAGAGQRRGRRPGSVSTTAVALRRARGLLAQRAGGQQRAVAPAAHGIDQHDLGIARQRAGAAARHRRSRPARRRRAPPAPRRPDRDTRTRGTGRAGGSATPHRPRPRRGNWHRRAGCRW